MATSCFRFSAIEKILQAYKPDSVLDKPSITLKLIKLLSFIWDKHCCLPLSAYPPSSGEQPSGTGIFGISAHKVYPTSLLPKKLVVSYTTFSPFPQKRWLFSVALSRLCKESRPLTGVLLFAVRTFLMVTSTTR